MTNRDLINVASPHFEFRHISDEELLRATLMNRSRQAKSGCWEWQRSRRNGYGMIAWKGREHSAHRLSYETFVGPIPKGLVVRHGCDNPCCVNPNHLRLGTQRDNVIDREIRGRRDVRGEQVGTSKLTEQQVREIKSSNLSLLTLAKKFDVDKSNIHAIKSGKAWKHVVVNNTDMTEQ